MYKLLKGPTKVRLLHQLWYSQQTLVGPRGIKLNTYSYLTLIIYYFSYNM